MCLWEVNLVVILQRPMTSIMLVMSQHSVVFMFHQDFKITHFSNYICIFGVPLNIHYFIQKMAVPQFCIVTMTYILMIKEVQYIYLLFYITFNSQGHITTVRKPMHTAL